MDCSDTIGALQQLDALEYLEQPPGGAPPAAHRGFAESTGNWYNPAAKGRATRGEALLAALLIRIHPKGGKKLAGELILAVEAAPYQAILLPTQDFTDTSRPSSTVCRRLRRPHQPPAHPPPQGPKAPPCR